MQKTHFSNPVIWLILLITTLLLGMTALGIHSWRLSNELAELKADPLSKSNRLTELVAEESDRAAQANPVPSGLLLTDPFGQFEQMQQQMDRLFSAAMTESWGARNSSPLSGIHVGTNLQNPLTFELQDTGDSFQVIIPVAEDTELELNTNIDNDVLSVAATMNKKVEQENGNMMSSSFSRSQYSRSIRLPEAVDPTGLSTDRQADQIVITIPKLS